MAFKRTVQLGPYPSARQLDAAMIGVGMRFTGPAARNPDIERTLVFASVQGMERDDLRVLAVLCTWLEVHAAFVNADRLFRLLETVTSTRTRAFWSAVGHWQRRAHRRFVRMERLYRGARVPLLDGDLPTTEFQIARRGEDARFVESALRAPPLRDRRSDVCSAEELFRHHDTYRWRVIIGPTYRADAWAELISDPTLSASELACRIGSSFGAARDARLHFLLARGSDGRPAPAPP